MEDKKAIRKPQHHDDVDAHEEEEEEEEEEDDDHNELTPPMFGGKNCPRCERDYTRSCPSCEIPTCPGSCPTVHRSGCRSSGVCAACGIQPIRPERALHPCKVCNEVLYCSIACETNHWRSGRHDVDCAGMQKALRVKLADEAHKSYKRKRNLDH